MSALPQPIHSTEPVTAADIQTNAEDGVIDPKYTDEATLTIVLDDFHSAEAWLSDMQWSLQWRDSKILYQSPRSFGSFEGSGVPRSSVPRFTVAKQVNSLAPAIHGAIFSDAVPFDIQPQGDTPQETAIAWKHLLNALLEDIGFKQEMKIGTHGCVLQGTVIFYAGWERIKKKVKRFKRRSSPKMLQMPLGQPMQVSTEESQQFDVVEEIKIINRPFFEKCQLGSVFVDPKWDKPNQIHKAAWIIYQFFATWEDLEKLRQNAEYDVPDEATLKAIFMPDGEQTMSESMVAAGLTEAASGIVSGAEREDRTTSEDPLLKPMQILERWTDDECWAVLQGKVVIRKGKHTMGRKPFFSGNFWDMEDTGYGLGVGRIAGTDQRVDTGLLNSALDIVSFAVNPIYAVSRDANAPTQDMRMRLGGIRQVTGEAGRAYALIPQPSVPADVWNVIQLSRSESESATGADQASVQGSLPGRQSSFGKSARGAGIIGKASAMRLQSPVENLCDGVIVPFLYFLVDMIRDHMPMSELLEILGGIDAGLVNTDLDSLMNADLRLDVLAGTRMAAREQMAQALPFLLEVFQNQALIAQLNQTGYKIDVMQIVQMVMDVSEWRNGRQLVAPMTPQEQQAYQQAQQGAQMAKQQAEQMKMQMQHQNDAELEDQKIKGRLVVDTAKQSNARALAPPTPSPRETAAKESVLQRAEQFATRDQLEHTMQGSQFYGG